MTEQTHDSLGFALHVVAMLAVLGCGNFLVAGLKQVAHKQQGKLDGRVYFRVFSGSFQRHVHCFLHSLSTGRGGRINETSSEMDGGGSYTGGSYVRLLSHGVSGWL